MLHAKYIIYLTRTLLFLNKKKFVFVIFFSFSFFFLFFVSSKESMHCGSEISAGYTGWMWKSLVFFVAKMSTDINFWGQCRSCIVAMFLFFESTKRAFNLKKRHHNTNGSFCSTPHPQLGSDYIEGKNLHHFPFLTATVISWARLLFLVQLRGHSVFSTSP